MDNLEEELNGEAIPSTSAHELTTIYNQTSPQGPDELKFNKKSNDTSISPSDVVAINPINSKPETNEICADVPSTSAAAAAIEMATNELDDTTLNNALECPICLQSCMHPSRLPCGHIFCFLCIKGVAYKNRRCALCRREITTEFLNHPQLVNGIKDICTTKATEDGYQWFYEGHNGWWQYDDRTGQDIEDAFKRDEKSCTILVAGNVYNINLETMMQQRQSEPARRRRVKRDLATIPKKGVAGLRIEGNTVTADVNFSTIHQQFENSNRPFIEPSLERHPDTLSTNRGNIAEFVSTIVATDTALRIAGDIIGSTLAHANEHHIQIPNAHLLSSNHMNRALNLVNTLGNVNNTSIPARSNNSIRTDEARVTSIGSPELLGAAENLLGATQRVIATADQFTINLFEQTLQDFNALTLNNLSVSPNSDGNELINNTETSTNDTTTQRLDDENDRTTDN